MATTTSVTETTTVVEAAAVLGVSENHLRNVIAKGDAPFPVLRIGRLIRIPRIPLLRLARGQNDDAPTGGAEVQS